MSDFTEADQARENLITDIADEICEDWRVVARVLDAYDARIGWQPIETAPKDGTRVLAWTRNAQSAFVAFWREHGLAPEDEERGWLTLMGVRATSEHGSDLSHWMPLPSPPPSSDKVVEVLAIVLAEQRLRDMGRLLVPHSGPLADYWRHINGGPLADYWRQIDEQERGLMRFRARSVLQAAEASGFVMVPRVQGEDATTKEPPR